MNVKTKSVVSIVETYQDHIIVLVMKGTTWKTAGCV